MKSILQNGTKLHILAWYSNGFTIAAIDRKIWRKFVINSVTRTTSQCKRKTVKLNERERENLHDLQVENSHNDILLNLFEGARTFFFSCVLFWKVVHLRTVPLFDPLKFQPSLRETETQQNKNTKGVELLFRCGFFSCVFLHSATALNCLAATNWNFSSATIVQKRENWVEVQFNS